MSALPLERLLTPFNSFTCPVVEITVGSDGAATKFYVHRNIICLSPYFERFLAREGMWKDCQNGQVSLQSADPDIFGIYVNWLYFFHQSLAGRDDSSLNVDIHADFFQPLNFLQLAQAYVLGDFFCDVKFAEAAAEAIITNVKRGPKNCRILLPGAEVIDYIYQNTEETSIARKTLIDVFVRYGSGQQFEKLKPAQDHLREFLVDLARTLVKKDLGYGSREYRSQKWFNDQEEPSPQFLFGVILDLLPDRKVLGWNTKSVHTESMSIV